MLAFASFVALTCYGEAMFANSIRQQDGLMASLEGHRVKLFLLHPE